MIFGISSHVFLQQRLHTRLLEAMVQAGARHIEICASRHHFDYTDRAAVRDIAAFFSAHDVGVSLHQPLSADAYWSRHTAPSLNLIDPEKQRRIDAMDEVKRALEAAEQIPFSAMVVHLGRNGEEWSARALEHSLTSMEHLNAFARPLGVRLLLENLENEVTSPEHLLEILRIGHFDAAGICFDPGHAHLNARNPGAPSLQEAFAMLRTRISQVDLHDNDGRTDQHLWPEFKPDFNSGGGQRVPDGVDWPEFLKQLQTLPAATPGSVEIAHELNETAETVQEKFGHLLDARKRLDEGAAFLQ